MLELIVNMLKHIIHSFIHSSMSFAFHTGLYGPVENHDTSCTCSYLTRQVRNCILYSARLLRQNFALPELLHSVLCREIVVFYNYLSHLSLI